MTQTTPRRISYIRLSDLSLPSGTPQNCDPRPSGRSDAGSTVSQRQTLDLVLRQQWKLRYVDLLEWTSKRLGRRVGDLVELTSSEIEKVIAELKVETRGKEFSWKKGGIES
jgi:hypothetical protein